MADILKQNKIPGREQLTRPEEIDALSKYLGNIKEIQDEHTELDRRILEVKGRGNKAFFPEVSLDDSIENLEKSDSIRFLDDSVNSIPNSSTDNNIKELNNTVIKGEADTTVKSLDDKVSKLEGDNVDPIEKLDNTVANSIENKGEELDSLNSSISKIANSDSSLKNLDDSIVKINSGNEVTELDDKISKIEPEDKVSHLENTVEELKPDFKVRELKKDVSNISENFGGEVSSLKSSIVDLIQNQQKEITSLTDDIVELSQDFHNSPESLNNSIETINTEDELEALDDSIENILQNVNKDISELEKYISTQPNNNNNEVSSLDNEIDELLVDNRTNSLNKSREDLQVEEVVNSLSDSVLELQTENKINSLDKSTSELEVSPLIKELSTGSLKLKVDEIINSLRNDVDTVEVESKVDELITSILERPYDKNLTKIKKALEEVDNLSTDEAFSNVIGLFDDISKDGNNSWVKKISAILTSAILQPDSALKIEKGGTRWYELFIAKLTEAMKIADVSQINSLRLPSSSNKVPSREELIRKNSENIESIPAYKLPNSRMPNIGRSSTPSSVLSDLTSGNLSLNGMDYAYFGIDNLVSASHVKGDVKAQMLKASLRAAAHSVDLGKRLLKMEPYRLPGTATDTAGSPARKIVGALKKAAVMLNDTDALYSTISNSIVSVIGEIGIKNRPNTDNNISGPRNLIPSRFYDNANKRRQPKSGLIIDEDAVTDLPIKSSVEDTSGELIDFANNYIYSEGIQTTLLDLCRLNVENSSTAIPSTFEDLQKILRDSPYITTPGKFGTDGNVFKSQTLSVTNYWEILLEPFVNKDMNGGFSYLPAIEEINLINQKKHGVNTGYSEWIPFTGFDMTLSKLNTKSVGLYDGEIVYPVSSELTNELRITIADDMYKSWTWYFKTAMEVSVYSSIPHDKAYYEGTSVNYPIAPTYVDKTCHCVALYKNITFRIRIYIMTPQYSTIKSFDLLCVLKDFSENYVGDVDTAGSPDLSLSFSVVGENPDKYVPPVNIITSNYAGVSNSPDKEEGPDNSTKQTNTPENNINTTKEKGKSSTENAIQKPTTSPTDDEKEEGVVG